MNQLRKFPINSRLWLAQILVFLMLLALGLQVSIQEKNAMYAAKEEKNRHVVETAIGILEHFHRLETSGALTQTAAQKAALEQVRTLRYGADDYFWINDQGPTMIMHPIRPELEGKDLSAVKDPSGKALFNDMVSLVRQHNAGSLPYLWAKPGHEYPEPKISYVQLFKPWGWILGTGIYVDDVEQEFKNYLLQYFLISLLLFLITASLMTLISRSITQPLHNTTVAMANIASGDADLTHQLDEGGGDELAILSRHFNQFTRNLRSMIQQLSDSANTLGVSSRSLSALAEQTYQQSQKQAQQIDLVATAINEVTYSVQEVAKNAEQASTEVKSAEQQALQGQRNIDNSLKQIEHLSQRITQSVEAMRSLADQSTQIGSVVEVIGSIAEQTNLLALNAAIEAARAGDQGRGFAVVADEVRLLAQRTQKSTAEIQAMIEQLQQNASVAVQVIQESHQAMQLTVEQASQAGESLAGITETTKKLALVNASIASATLQQTHVAENINQNITLTADLAQQGTNTAEQSNEASKHLGALADALSQLLKRFRV